MNPFKIALIFLLFSNSSYAQDYHQSKSELENEILGTWYYENDPKSKTVFYDDGTLEEYYEEKMKSTSNYEITNFCDGEKFKGRNFFIKKYTLNGTSCSYIEAINYNENGIFSMITKSQGKIIVLQRK